MLKPTERFSDRVGEYLKYRPSYPPGVLDTLEQQCNLTQASVIADIGAGTGKLSELFLQRGSSVYGVEPNQEMREAGANLLSDYANFRSINGTAEASTLAADSADFVTAGQAFHWFDVDQARPEFARILRPNGWVVLVWNVRVTTSDAFTEAYEQLISKYAIDYASVNHRRVPDETIAAFFGPRGYQLATCPNQQSFDFEGLKGRLLSSSYIPQAAHPNYAPMISALHKLFDEHQTFGQVTVRYETKMYYGQLT